VSRCDSLSRVTVTFVLSRFLSYVVRGSTRVVQLVISSLCVSLGDVSLGYWAGYQRVTPPPWLLLGRTIREHGGVSGRVISPSGDLSRLVFLFL
jgi:hypothetical protein